VQKRKQLRLATQIRFVRFFAVDVIWLMFFGFKLLTSQLYLQSTRTERASTASCVQRLAPTATNSGRAS
jgi:hypothetical protein